MEVTIVGTTLDGEKVTAATDDAGPQVIVLSDTVHLLSRPLANHADAIALGERVVKDGHSAYSEWYDLRKASVGKQLFAIFGGVYR